MPKRQFVPDHEHRVAAITHVVYEYANFIVAGYYSIYGAAPWRTNCDDAFLLGCRKLDEFLMKDTRMLKGDHELDDVLALDYLPEKKRDWDLPIWSSKWRGPMNKQLAHIAYARDAEWNHVIWVPQLEKEFRKAWWKFRESIIDEEYSQEFERQLTICQRKEGFENMALDKP